MSFHGFPVDDVIVAQTGVVERGSIATGIHGFPGSRRFVTRCLGVASSSVGTVLNTKGVWVAYNTAATEEEYDGLYVECDVNSNDVLSDLAYGQSGPEVIIATDLFAGAIATNGNLHGGHSYHIPVRLPAGVRLWMRSQSNTLSFNTAPMTIFGLRGSYGALLGCTGFETIGAQTVDSGGRQIDPGGSANTYGSWVELGSTTREWRGFQLSIGDRFNDARSSAAWLLDVSFGVPGAEELNLMIDQIRLNAHSNGDMMSPEWVGPFPCAVPAGSPISARTQCTITDGTDRLFDLIVYGLAV